MTTLINAKTAATISDTFSFRWGDGFNSVLQAEGLGSGENAILEFTIDEGTTWTEVFISGTAVKMTSTNNMILMNVPGKYRINKDATAAPVTIVLLSRSNT